MLDRNGGSQMDNWNELIKLYNNYGFKGIEQSYGTIFHYTSPEGLIGMNC